ncbi:MAG: ATP-binding cassette domain-containing protein [Mycobacteriaceae bacterium]
MGFLEAGGLAHVLPDGRELYREVSLKVADGAVVALVGENGVGKSTLLRTLAGELTPTAGSVRVVGGLAAMPQLVGSAADGRTVSDLLLDVSAPAVQAAAAALAAAELAMMETDDEPTQLRYATALADWAEAGGYEAEVAWDVVCTAALGVTFDRARFRDLDTLSGGEQKRLALEALLRGPAQVLLLDEPDNYLDVPGKRWLEAQLAASTKAILLISHDRALLAAAATAVVTVEAGTAWTHAGRFGTWPEARQARWEKVAQLRRRWSEEHERLRQLVLTLRQQAASSPDMASRYHAMQTRFAKFEAVGPPAELPRTQTLAPRLTGGRTALRAVTCEDLELTGLMHPFSTEVFFGDRVAVLGSNGSGKSHFLRLLAGLPHDGELDAVPTVAHTGIARLGARVVPGMFAQTHAHPELVGRTLLDVLWNGEGRRAGMGRSAASSALDRYGLVPQAEQSFETLSGGQQARLQVLLLELGGATLLLLDEPTDNLDLVSAEALQTALSSFNGTVLAVTHDRWFAQSFDRFLVFRADGTVVAGDEPVWDESRVVRAR